MYTACVVVYSFVHTIHKLGSEIEIESRTSHEKCS